MSLATVASVIGIGSGIKNLTGGSGGSSNAYVPTGQGGADSSWQQFMQQMQQLIGQNTGDTNPVLQQAFQKMLGIDTSGVTAAGQTAGQGDWHNYDLSNLYSQMMRDQAGQAFGSADQLKSTGNQVWQTAQDPQKALQTQLQQQVTDASRAGTSARGIGMGGESAGIENKAVSDFLINWQNQQLQRQLAGGQGQAGMYDAAGRQGQLGNANLVGSMNFGALAPQYAMQAGMDPFQANMTAAQLPFQATGAYQQGVNNNLSQYGGAMAQIMPYLNFGQTASNNAFGQQQYGLNNLAWGANQLGKSSLPDWLNSYFSPAQPGAGTGAGGGGTSSGFFPFGGDGGP